nr:glycoside hydrolase family 3 C-terminal domain-containing protein [Clostridia bacterium]
MYNLLSTFLNTTPITLDESLAAQSNDLITRIGEQGFVLVRNENDALPLDKDVSKLNVFGWASTKPYLGGTGSSESGSEDVVDLLEALANGGYEVNTTLTDMYTAYAAERPVADMFGQNMTLPEPTMDYYTEELMAEAKTFSDTAIVVIARGGGENYDLPSDMNAVINGTYNIASEVSINPDVYPYTKVTYQNNGDYDDFEPGESYLELSVTEEKLLELVCANFENVIVIINACNPMELGFLETYDIDAALLTPAPGARGFDALGNILSGLVNPSGRTVDTYVYDLQTTPTANNTGIFTYTGFEALAAEILAKDSTYQGTMSFVNYNEGIYIGYKFYETAAEEGLIDYAATVQYPFGYGLSYTTFDRTIESFTDTGDVIEMTVRVTNTGRVPGRDVVEVYYTPPYYNGGIEKSSVNLIDFAKTEIIPAGGSVTVSFTIVKESMASYDENGLKVTGGGYVLEAGEYAISVRADSHTVNDQKSFTVAEDIIYNTASNQLQDTARGDFEQLSRKDGFANYAAAVAAPSAEAHILTEAISNAIRMNTVAGYDADALNNPDDVKPTQGDKNVTLKLVDMVGADYDDPRWEELLNRLSFKDMNNLINNGGYGTPEIKNIDKVQTNECDGPAGVNNYMTKTYGTAFPAEVLMAQTWSKEIAFDIGASIGSELAGAQNYGWYAPAMNLHRSAFAGRNFEYYSEDGVLSGYIGLYEANGAAQYGVYPYLKHFALNDQELNRTAILLTFAGEQNIRENYLKPFEITVKGYEGKALGVMSSYVWIGTVPAYANGGLLNGILRGEWGFKGAVISDYDGSYGFMITDAAIRNGGDMMLNTVERDSDELSKKEPTVLLAMRQATKNILYTVVNSAYYTPYTVAQESVEETVEQVEAVAEPVVEEPVEQVNKMDQLFGKINTISGVTLGALECILLIWLVLKLRKKTAK